VSPTDLIRADRVEAAVLTRAVERAAAYRLDLDRRLARLIVTEFGEALKRGSRRGG
jgi:hypothetical protein